ncbi:MAG TPA: nucleotide pyrophosphatase/phosphodiesterase family protein [Gemmataceae bacterium]|nr:nucleotide pyrophosphatase/phosphodiesterase family protein [Gemmataceae bacterium]
MTPLVILNTVGLTTRHLPLAPRLHALAQTQWSRPFDEILPALTCSAQASMLTGKLPTDHGIVGNGWLYRDTMEVRFWQQSNRLIQAEPVYATLGKLGIRTAKLFWWFNQGADVHLAVTPKPHYGADGSKAFDILSWPDVPEMWAQRLTRKLGAFPFPTFWGPMAGLPCTEWIARAAAEVLTDAAGPPGLTLVYLPHLDYDTQRFGPAGCDWGKLVGELDSACAPVLDAAKKIGATVWVVNEYAHLQVDQPIYINRALRQHAFLSARDGPFGEQLDTFGSAAFAVCDHQIAHVYLNASHDALRIKVSEHLKQLPSVDRIYAGSERAEIGLDHPRAGDLVVLAKPNAWFAYPFWLDDRRAPDYARTVDIHRKPGYDPCELFFDPKLLWGKGRAIGKVMAKKLGLRTLVDVIPLDASLVRGSHGIRVSDAADKPVFIGSGAAPADTIVPQTALRDRILQHFGQAPG